MRTRNWLIHLYPWAWRERYGEEFEALLEHCRLSPLEVLDVIGGALDARLSLVGEAHSTRRMASMSYLQHSKALTLAATMVVTAAVFDLTILLLAAFAWFQGIGVTAAAISAAGAAATFGFVAIAARKLHEAREKST